MIHVGVVRRCYIFLRTVLNELHDAENRFVCTFSWNGNCERIHQCVKKNDEDEAVGCTFAMMDLTTRAGKDGWSEICCEHAIEVVRGEA